ncbi:MAG: hypothetical protein WC087_00065 [Candidatus Paceibacterota bacterium]
MFSSELVGNVIDFLFSIIPIVIPFILFWVLVKMFIDANRAAFLASQDYVLLDITPPQDVEKSPAAMELFLTALYQTGGESTWYDRLVQGKVRAWFSLEIVSLGGNVRFFIWTRKNLQRLVESQLYSQFPGIEVTESDDYTMGLAYDGSIELFGVELKLTEPDAFPIKTYVDYGIDKETEEEFKIDPITPVIETLGTLSPGHQMWIQIIVRAHKKEDLKPGTWNTKQDNWKEGGKEAILKIREDSKVEVGDGENKRQQVAMTKGQELRITALERSIAKLSFDTGVRMIYLAEKSVFDSGYIGAMTGSFRQYNSPDLNSFGPKWTTSFDYPWQDISGKRVSVLKDEILEAYKDRDYFWRDRPQFGLFGKKIVEREAFVLNTEELATIFHFPGRVSSTPSLRRVDSKKATPPANLPI